MKLSEVRKIIKVSDEELEKEFIRIPKVNMNHEAMLFFRGTSTLPSGASSPSSNQQGACCCVANLNPGSGDCGKPGITSGTDCAAPIVPGEMDCPA